MALSVDEIVTKIGDILASGEGNYESYNTGTKGVPGQKVGHSFVSRPAGTITGKTISQIIATEGKLGTDRDRLFATGKYQTIIPTLRQARDALGLTGNELYDAAMQERVFRDFLLHKAGGGVLAKFIFSGTSNAVSAQNAAAKEWASIGVPAGLKNKNGLVSDGYISFYEKTGQNKASKSSTDKLRTLLQLVEQERGVA